ncbi:GSCOCG00013163001-RA-CDS [Cotesia congregata]|nr:GSCOCG00013163001-RA-CDS [Cotesia congregata]
MNSSSIQSTDIFIPDYIWLDIFKHVSPLKLAVLRWTSKPFKNIIEEMIENNYTWKNLCSTNSIKPWIWKIQEKLFSYVKKYSPKELDKNWKDVLHSYGYWRVYSKRSFKFITFNLRDNLVNYNHITCSDAFGDYFAIASDRGDIFLFTIENDRIYLLHTFAGNQYEIYRQLKFWNAGKIKLSFMQFSSKLCLIRYECNCSRPTAQFQNTVVTSRFPHRFITSN